MRIYLKHSGETVNGYHTSIQLHIEGKNSNIVEEVLNLDLDVREDVLNDLERVVKELKEQKELLK